MVDDGRREPEARPAAPTIPDLGFFAQPGVAASANQFGSPPANPFGSTPVNQFGSPVNQFGSPTGYAPVAPPAPSRRGMSAGMTALIAGVVLVALVVVVVGGRFGWQQFVADPVVPETLMGMPQVTGATVDGALAAAKDSVGEELTAGSEAKVGLYSDGGTGVYIVFALRGGSNGTGEGDMPDGWTQTRHGKVDCFQPPAGTAEASATMCARAFFRRAVLVMSIGPSTSASTVAEATDEAWRAQ